MSKIYVCGACGYEYDPAVGDPDNGIKPGTPFENLPEDWVCPVCGMGKDVFEEKLTRSEERRVGKECRSRWSPYH